jgi:hypothetical protein
MSNGWYPATDFPNIVGRFTTARKVNVIKTKEARRNGDVPTGGLVYDDVVVCQCKATGEQDMSVIEMKEKNTGELTRRFPLAWAEYNKQPVEIEGIPIDQLPGINPDVATFYKASGLWTIEALAKVDDGTTGRLGHGARYWIKSARAHLEKVERDERAARVTGGVAGAPDGDNVAPFTVKRGPGRPRKEANGG